MKRAILLAILLLPLAQAAPFLQPGGNAGRNGALADSGPRDDDVALVVPLPGEVTLRGAPLISDGHALALTVASTTNASLTAQGLFDITLDTGAIRAVASFDATPWGMASDGTTVFVATSAGVEARALSDGSIAWKTPYPVISTNAMHDGDICTAPAFDGDRIVVLCRETSAGAPPRAPEGPLFAIALASASGDLLWTWTTTKSMTTATCEPTPPVPDVQAASTRIAPISAAIIGDRVILHAATNAPLEGGLPLIWALDITTGEIAWRKSLDTLACDYITTSVASVDPIASYAMSNHVGPNFFVGGDAKDVFAVWNHTLVAYRTSDGLAEWHRDLPFPEPQNDIGDVSLSPNLAVTPASVIVEHEGRFVRVDRAATDHPTNATPYEGSLDVHYICHCGVLVANDTAYGVPVCDDPPPAVGGGARACHGESQWPTATYLNGTRKWVATIDDPPGPGTTDLSHYNYTVDEPGYSAQMALGDGLFIVQSFSTLYVFGHTAAAPTPKVALANSYPARGELARADLSGALAGTLGRVTRYRADWGDDTAATWVDSPILTHTYVETGERLARFSVANAAGQSASIYVPIHVGATPPATPTLLMRALDPSNQNLVFGIIGLAATGAGGLVALFARQRKRSVLAREMRALDEARERTRGDEPGWRAAIAQKRAHHADLLRRRRIDSGELLVLERRIELLSAGASPEVRAAPIAVGALLLGRYRVDRLLGEGGQGRAFLARDETIGRDVVVKAVPTAGLGGQAKRLLLAEARLAGALDHPNVVRVLDVIDGESEAYLILEYVEGGTLRALLRRGPVPRREALRLFRGILAALAAAHARGIVHGDVKPENVLLSREGVPKLADFGTAHEARPDATIAAVGIGTLRYMSPEQIRGRPADARSDLYAASAILVEMLTGASHLGSAPMDDFQMRARILEGAPAPQLGAQAADLRGIIERGLATDPAARFQTAQEILSALPDA